MNACRYRMCLAVAFVVILALPFVQKATKMFPSRPLVGSEAHVPKADWSLRLSSAEIPPNSLMPISHAKWAFATRSCAV